MLLIAVSAQAQSTFGSIRGVAKDTSGAAIPSAGIMLHSVDENRDKPTTSDASGAFLFENLKPGHYTVHAQVEGFASLDIKNILLNPRQDLRLDLNMVIATQATSIEVTDSGNQINTENAIIGDSVDNQQITQLPLNSRATTTSPLNALALSPNVQQDSTGNIALGGASSSMVNFSVDGISTANVRQNGALQDAYPSQEGISGVKVTAFNNNAEFSQVGDVTFSTKSGTSQYHGSLFEYLQNDALDASPYGFNGKAPKRFNTFGGSIGGPVMIPHVYSGKDKTFFFFDYEANRRTTAIAQQFKVPTTAERNGDLRALNPAANQITNINPVAVALLNTYYPLCTPALCQSSGINYEHFQPTPARTDGADIRLDETISTKQSIYARFSRKNITSNVANNLLPNDIDDTHNRSLLVSHTYTITQHMVNEFRFGFTNVVTSVNFPIAGSSALSQLGLPFSTTSAPGAIDISQHPTTHAFPTFSFQGQADFTSIGRDKAGVTQSKTMQFADNLTYTYGKHTFKGGIDVRRLRYFDIETFVASDDFGQFVFQDNSPFTGGAGFTPTGIDFGDFLQGAPTTLFYAVSSPDVGGKVTQFSFFGQDEYQVNSRLTLNYGLRWQMLPAFHEDGGNLANFDQNTNSIVVPDELAGYLSQNNLTASNAAFQQSFNACNLNHTALPCTQYLTASQAHLPQSLRHTYMKNFQPRFSVAYRPFNDSKTVIRSGFGVYTMTNLGPLSFNNSGNPTSNLHNYTNTPTGTGGPSIQFPSVAPPSAGVQYGGGSLDQGVDPNYRDPQSNQWNVTVERQVGRSDTLRVSYVGMHTYRLSITEDLNQIHASTTPFATTAASPYVDPRSPFPNWVELYSTFNAGKANYKALEIEETHKLSHGLFFDANYTLAENKADNQGDVPSGFAGEVNYGIPIADRFNIPANYGNEEGTRRNRFLLTGVYQLPIGAGRAFANHAGWLDYLIGGWELNNVTLLESGPWMTPSISQGHDASNTNVAGRGALLRPDVVSTDFYKGQSRARYFNPLAFAATPSAAGRFGNAGVGILQGPGTEAVSLGLAKTFKVTDTVKVRFESTFTNVLNHTNFAPPSTQVPDTPTPEAVNASLFGVLQSAQTAEGAGNRTGQAALRIDF